MLDRIGGKWQKRITAIKRTGDNGMITIFEIPTCGDSMTLPGGVALRAKSDGSEFIVHSFNTDRETGRERHYFQGSYFMGGSDTNAFMNALTEFSRRAERASTYGAGGSIDTGKLLGKQGVAAD